MAKFIPFILIILLVGCSKFTAPTVSRPVKSTSHEPQTEQKEQAPKFVTPSSEPTEVQEKEIEQTAPETSTAQEPSYKFSELESQHVSKSSYDPFPAGGNSFTIHLDNQKYTYPIQGKLISAYGARGRSWHSGCDIKGAPGLDIYALFDGVVRMSKPYSGYGYLLVIRHDNGLETAYGHCSKLLAQVGDRVQAGQCVALCGRTGRASTEHLHFEVRVMGQVINPMLVLDVDNRTLRSGDLVISRQGSKIVASGQSGSSQSRPNQPAAPMVSSHSQEQTTTTSTTSLPSTTAKSSPAKSYHTVVKGDTLYALALRNHTTVKAICSLNSITAKTVLALGRKLRIK
ncbi:MAG: M23 family metallopeptidase [Mucinivorans sp.]